MSYPQSLSKDNILHSKTVLFLTTVTLVGIGLVMIYSASAIVASIDSDHSLYKGDSLFYLRRQLYWLGLSIAAFIGFSLIPYQKFQDVVLLLGLEMRVSHLLLGLGIALLILTLTPWFGAEVNESRRWFKIPKIGRIFQTAEMVKVILIIFMADFISRKQNVIKELKRGLLPLLIPIGIIGFLVLKQPHLAMSLLIGMVALALLVVGGARLKYLIGMVVLVFTILCGLVIWSSSPPYQLERVLATFSPDSPVPRRVVELLYPNLSPIEMDRVMKSIEGRRYHLTQLLPAISNGGVFGQGSGGSEQKIFYLPTPHADSIFAILAEEFGFLGTGFVILLFLIFLWTGRKIALESKDMFGSLLAFGLTIMIVLQGVINIAVSTGMIPTTGLPLPFISYGGSSLFFTLIGVGILLNISKTVVSKQ